MSDGRDFSPPSDVAVHEAGHACVAFVLGGLPTCATALGGADETGPYQGGVYVDRYHALPAHDRAVVDLSGVVAESLWAGQELTCTAFLAGGGADAANFLTNFHASGEADLERFFDNAAGLAAAILREHSRSVEALACHLAEFATATQAEITAAFWGPAGVSRYNRGNGTAGVATGSVRPVAAFHEFNRRAR
jgi:hypothetical protein